MSNKLIEYTVSVRDRVSGRLGRISNSFKKMGSAVSNSLKHPVQTMMRFKGALLSVAAVAATFAITVKKAFQFESLTVQFSVLFKDMEKAKLHMEELKAFSGATPFQLEDIAKASRSLHVFTDGVLGSVASLGQIGDAAAATGNNIKELSFWVGRAYSSISSGRPFGEAAMRLQEMGVLGGEARTKMEDLQKAGASNAEVWAVLTDAMDEYNGGMKTLAETGDGLISTLKDNWTLALAEIGEAFAGSAKGGITEMIDSLKKLREDGSLAEWATIAVQKLTALFATLKTTSEGIKSLYEKSGAKHVIGLGRKTWKASTAWLGTQAAGAEKGWGELKKGNIGGAVGEFFGGAYGKDSLDIVKNAWMETDEKAKQAANEKEAAKAKSGAAAKHADKSAEENKNMLAEAKEYGVTLEEGMTKAEKQKAIQAGKTAKDLAAKQENADKKAAKKKAEDELKEREKLESAEVARLAKLAKAQAKALEQAQDEERKDKAGAYRKQLEIYGGKEALTANRLSRANQAVNSAWAEFSDPELFKSNQQARDKDEALRENWDKKWRDKAERLINKPQSFLNDREKAAVRMLKAEKEQAKAEAALLEIATNTKETKDMLKQLLTRS